MVNAQAFFFTAKGMWCLITALLLAACAASSAPPSKPEIHADESDAQLPLPPVRNSVSPAVKICGPAPKLPDSILADPNFRRAQVLVQFRQLPTGETADVKVERSSGYPALDYVSVQAVKKWRCGIPAAFQKPVLLAVPFEFRITPKPENEAH